jgi:hypothetical protein
MLGEDAHAAAFAHIRDEFRTDLYASIELSMQRHGVAYIPGAAELGDSDFTSPPIRSASSATCRSPRSERRSSSTIATSPRARTTGLTIPSSSATRLTSSESSGR